MNGLKTFLLLLGLTILLVWAGQIIGGTQGMITALIIAGIMNFVSFWFSDKIVLMMYGAKQVNEAELPNVFSIVRKLTQRNNLPMPKIYIIETETPNAFATGRNPSNAAVAVTRGIIRLLDENELEGVIAHELSHIKNRDTLIAVIAATIAGAIFTLARIAQFAVIFGSRDRDNRNGGGLGLLILMIIAPIAALILQLAISRSREYIADESAGKMTGKPLALADALRKLTYSVERIPMQASPTTSHLFIVNPLKSERGAGWISLFSTHPPVKERIKKLEELAIKMSITGAPRIIY